MADVGFENLQNQSHFSSGYLRKIHASYKFTVI